MGYTFISGATGGIGKAFCIESAKRGYDLFLTGRSQEKLSLLKEELLKINSGIDVLCFPCDLSSEEDRKKMFDHIKGLNVKFERVINVAGVDTQKAFLEYTREKMLFQISVNVSATIDVTRFLLDLREEKAEIITISSMSGISPMPYFAIYSATKAMLTNFFTALHYELKNKNVKVTTILPSGVYTRPDILKEIESQGLWGKITARKPEYIVKKSFKAVKKNKIKYIPGFINRVLNCLMAIAPKRIVLGFIAHRWKTHKKDAF